MATLDIMDESSVFGFRSSLVNEDLFGWLSGVEITPRSPGFVGTAPGFVGTGFDCSRSWLADLATLGKGVAFRYRSWFPKSGHGGGHDLNPGSDPPH